MKSAGLDFPIEDEVAIYHEEQQKHLLTTSQYTQKNKAKQPAFQSNLIACAESPESEEPAATSMTSKKKQIESFGLPLITGYKLLKVATEKQKQLWMNHKEREI